MKTAFRQPENRSGGRLRRSVRILCRSAAALVAVVLLYLAAAEILGRIPLGSPPERSAGDIDIYLSSNGVHTDIIMPLSTADFDWRTQVAPTIYPAAYVAIGWGDRKFYLDTPHWRDLTAATAFGAVSGLHSTAMHVSFLPQAPAEGEQTVRVRITQQQYRRLVARIADSFARDAEGRPLPIAGAAYGVNDAFYEARGRYHLFQTCNSWANSILRQSGLPHVVWTPFAHHLLNRYR